MLRRASASLLLLAGLTMCAGCEQLRNLPTTPSGTGDGTTQLTVVVGSSCSNRLQYVTVHVDNVFWGQVAPGREITKRVAVGVRGLAGTSDNQNYVWTENIDVPRNGLEFTLTCS